MNTTIAELESIRKRLKKIRFDKGFTQEFMADKLDISQNSYHKLENGRTKICLRKFIDISKVLEIEISELINGPEKTYSFTKYYKTPIEKVF